MFGISQTVWFAFWWEFTEFEPATGDNVKENNNISKADSATKQVI